MHTQLWWHSMRKGLGASLGAFTILISGQVFAGATVGTDDYPYRGSVGMVDPWGFFTGYCTSFVAWRLSQAGVRFQSATLIGPNGQSRFFGNAGEWDRAAAEAGFTVDARPTPGSVGIWHGGEGGAWPGGHAAYVVAVDGAGRVTVEEYNWSVRFGYGMRTTQAPRYIHFTAPTAAFQPPAPPARSVQPSPSALRQYHTTAAVRARTGPGTMFAVVRVIPTGAAIQIACQVRSSSVINGSGIWDRLVDGTYVTDYYTTTPAFNDFTLGVPGC